MTSTAVRIPRRSPQTTPPAPRPPRDPWFDNAKMLLVALVVVGHSWVLLPDNVVNARLYNFLYLWHMPAFVFLTGYLSRRFTYSRRNLRRVVTALVLPYLVFEGAYALFRVHLGGETFERLWLNPHWPLWYLVATAIWRLATPVLRSLPMPPAWAVGLSLLGGLVSVETFDLNRVLGFLPFFVLGLVVEQRHLDLLRTTTARYAGLAVLAVGVWAAGVIEYDLGTSWVYYRNSYAELGTGPVEGALLRLTLLALGTAMAAAALAWVPTAHTWFTRMGAASLVVYLFHGFPVRGAEYAGVASWAADHPVLSLPLVSGVAAVAAFALAWRPVSKRLEKVVTPAP